MPKKIPLRQCVGCREMKPKKELIRVVKSPEGEVSLDFKGKKPGRGMRSVSGGRGSPGRWSGRSPPPCPTGSTTRWRRR